MKELCEKYEVETDGLKALLPVTERIKTFEDAYLDLGKDHPLCKQYTDIKAMAQVELPTELLAYLRLRIINAALNEGWEPEFSVDEYRYFPWFYLFTQEEIDKMDEEQKSRVLGRSYYVASAVAGVAYSSTSYAASSSSAGCGARLCFKERALAEYAGRQFLKEWSDFMGFTK